MGKLVGRAFDMQLLKRPPIPPTTTPIGERYQVVKDGDWEYNIIDTQSRIKIGSGEAGQEVVLVTYSKVVADICEAALNANIEKITAHTSPVVNEK